MRRLIFLVLLLGLLALADIAVRSYAEEEIERRAIANLGDSVGVAASIESFPFTPPLLSAGKAGNVQVTVTGLDAGSLRFAALDVRLLDVRIDESRLRAGREVLIRGVDRAEITAAFDIGDLAEATGLPLSMDDGVIRLSVGGRSIEVSPEVTTEGSLSLRGGPEPVVLPGLGDTGLSGCRSASARVSEDRLVVSCRTGELPPMFARAARAASRG